MDAAEADEETVELPPIDEKRLLDMTRTVQLSVEQITANMDIPAGEDTDTSSDDDAAEEGTPATMGEDVYKRQDQGRADRRTGEAGRTGRTDRTAAAREACVHPPGVAAFRLARTSRCLRTAGRFRLGRT